VEREVAIVRVRAPGVAESLARRVASVVRELRKMDLYKLPGIAETVDWTRALAVLADGGGADSVDTALLDATLGSALKYQEDLERVREVLPTLPASSEAG
jgi:hypothetical protein